MKAIEFVRIVGVEKVKSILLEEGLSCFIAYLPGDSWPDPSTILGSDLREIVEAFEIISLFKNLRHALIECDTSDSAGHSQILVKIEGSVRYIDVLKVRKAIFLVEQCNAKS